MGYNKKYSKYLHTKEWVSKRNKIREERKCCELCGSTDKLQVHHLTYENLGNEKDEDLMLLCENCHNLEHKGKILTFDNVDLNKCFEDDNSKQLILELFRKLDFAIICSKNPKMKLFSSEYYEIIKDDKEME